MNQHHPYVSEVRRGQAGIRVCVLGVVIVALVVAFLGYTMAATVIIAVTAIVTACCASSCARRALESPVSPVRRHYRHRFGLGLLLLYFAPSLFWIR